MGHEVLENIVNSGDFPIEVILDLEKEIGIKYMNKSPKGEAKLGVTGRTLAFEYIRNYRRQDFGYRQALYIKNVNIVILKKDLVSVSAK